MNRQYVRASRKCGRAEHISIPHFNTIFASFRGYKCISINSKLKRGRFHFTFKKKMKNMKCNFEAITVRGWDISIS